VLLRHRQHCTDNIAPTSFLSFVRDSFCTVYFVKMKLFFFSALFVFVAAAPQSTAAAVSPPQFSIKSYTSGGTGCPDKDVTVSIVKNGAFLGVDFPGGKLAAASGAGVSEASQSTTCSVSIDFMYSAGYQFQVYSPEVYGYANVSSDAKTRLETNIRFSGGDSVASLFSCFFSSLLFSLLTRVQLDAVWYITGWDESGLMINSFHAMPGDNKINDIWSPCGGEGLFTSATTITFQEGTGSITLDKEASQFTELHGLNWRTC
jgi:hypothetical protein